MTNQKAILSLPNGKSLELEVKQGTEGNPVIDVGSLIQEGYFTFDPGFFSTSSCESKITFIDGDKGILTHRGYPIEQLAEKSSFLELSYLLIEGELPSQQEYDQFVHHITYHTMLHEQVHRFLNGFRRDAHPMSIICGVVGALASFYHDSLDIFNTEHRKICAHRFLAKMPTIVAMAYKYSIGMPFTYPKNNLAYVENFMQMFFSNPCEEYEIDPVLARALEVIFMLHADHEQNASTSTVRMIGSTGANPFACLAGGVAALWGPAHGGANEAVIAMLNQIEKVENIPEFINKAKDKDDPFRLMGFGHRVYKNFDPRAKIMKKLADSVLERLKIQDPLLDIAKKLEEIALEDNYFVERKLYPNVDFYSGIILKAMRVPLSMFTPFFALARTVGWYSHWNEMIYDDSKISRPRQLYTGAATRDYPSDRNISF